jgi:hypothetical protein
MFAIHMQIPVVHHISWISVYFLVYAIEDHTGLLVFDRESTRVTATVDESHCWIDTLANIKLNTHHYFRGLPQSFLPFRVASGHGGVVRLVMFSLPFSFCRHIHFVR